VVSCFILLVTLNLFLEAL